MLPIIVILSFYLLLLLFYLYIKTTCEKSLPYPVQSLFLTGACCQSNLRRGQYIYLYLSKGILLCCEVYHTRIKLQYLPGIGCRPIGEDPSWPLILKQLFLDYFVVTLFKLLMSCPNKALLFFFNMIKIQAVNINGSTLI